jgi:hypothetical protein
MGMSLVESSASVFVPKDYCYGAKFSSTSGGCPNFNPSDGVVGGQGNDIALIHINRKFNANEVYPQLAPPESYPQQYTMAPILSLGFGVNNVNGRVGQMFYVTNYFYQKSDSLGYHYLHNSYFNTNATNFGYSALICGGDSGGPDLFWNGHNWILLSEHTYGLSDSCGGFYNELTEGATNVSSYYGWLTSIMNATNPVAYCQTESANCTANS